MASLVNDVLVEFAKLTVTFTPAIGLPFVSMIKRVSGYAANIMVVLTGPLLMSMVCGDITGLEKPSHVAPEMLQRVALIHWLEFVRVVVDPALVRVRLDGGLIICPAGSAKDRDTLNCLSNCATKEAAPV